MKKKITLALLFVLIAAMCAFAGCDSCKKKEGYAITVSATQNGSVTADKQQAEEGETVNLTLAPDEGYNVSSLTVNGGEITVENNAAAFVMPAENVTVEAAFIADTVKEDAPTEYAFKLNAYLNKVMAKSAWAYEYGEEALKVTVWVQDEEYSAKEDGVKMYFGTSANAYEIGSRNLGVQAFASGKTVILAVENGEYTEKSVEGVSVKVAPWTIDGENRIGYKAQASVEYAALGFKTRSAALNSITMLPQFVNGNKTSPVPITVSHEDAGYAARPNTYPVLSGGNKITKNTRYCDSNSFGNVGAIASGEKWRLEEDYTSVSANYANRRVFLNDTDAKDNNLLFRSTYGRSRMYAEATFRITEVYGSERWGKFGFMLFDGSAYNGLFCYVDAYIGDNTPVMDNIVGTSLGYNRANNGWSSNWTTISGTSGSLNLTNKTVTLKMSYTGSQVYLYCGDTLVFSQNYTASSQACIGIKSFNYGLELTDYFVTDDMSNEKFAAHVPKQIDFANAFTVSGGTVGAVNEEMKITEYTKTFTAQSGQSGVLYVKNSELNSSPAYSVLINGNLVENAEKIYSSVNDSCLRYDLGALNAGENTVTFAYITKPASVKVKLAVTSGASETDMTGAASSWQLSQKDASAEKPVYYFLGSSVTYGATTGGVSFVEKVAKILGVECQKEAVSGTTLAKVGANSYVDRLANLDKNKKVEKLVVQLSTNDATQNVNIGAVAEGTNKEDFDLTTTVGAIEYIIAYAKEVWNAEVVFYTNPKYSNGNYEKLVSALYEVQKKWGIEIIDFFNYRDMEALSDGALSAMMSDAIHPNDAGYEWMSGIFAGRLNKYFEEKILKSFYSK